jgi:hypothetical protein
MKLRHLVGLFAAIVSIAFASAAFPAQPTKKWSITVTPANITTAAVTITIKNETPNGNSSINSFKLVMPAGYTVDTANHPNDAVTTTYPGVIDLSTPGTIAMSNMSPLKPQQSFDLIAYLNISPNTGCTPTNWATSSKAWTGSSFSGDTFLLIFSTATGADPNNTLAFQNVAASVPVGTDITGSVKATSCGGVPNPTVSVKVDLVNSANTVVATASKTTSASTGIAGVYDFPTTLAGSYKLRASATNYTTIETPVTVCGNVLSFNPAPANVKSGDPVSASIQADSCGNLASGVSITAKVKDAGGTVVDSATVSSDANGLSSFQFTNLAHGKYTLEGTAANYTPDPLSAPFTVFDGILDCGDPFGSSFVNPDNVAPDQPGYAEGMRNSYNKDGSDKECVPVLYTFTNDIPSANTVNLTWDTASQPNAAFEYTMNWQAQEVETTVTTLGDPGWPITLRPSVAWLNADGSETTGLSTNQAWVPGLACLGSKLPAPYGTLVNAVDDQATSTSIKVTGIASNPASTYSQPVPGDPAIPAYPFPIVIANTVGGVQTTATERMLVTGDTSRSSSAGVWTITFTVQRGNGLTTRAAHDAGYRVMSTPLPLIPTNDPTNFPAAGVYVPGTQAHMCIAAHGFTSYDFAGGIAHVLYKTRVFDIGDGWVRGF